jgi:hypothetical protein
MPTLEGFDTPLDEDSLAATFGGETSRPKRSSPSVEGGGASPPKAVPRQVNGALPKSAPTLRVPAFEKRLTEFYSNAAAMLCMIDPTCGTVFAESAEQMAHSMCELAANNPAVKRVLMGLLEKTALTAVIAAHTPLVVAVLAHHTKLPQMVARRTLGDADAPPEVVEAMAKAMVDSVVSNARKAATVIDGA